MMAYFRNTNAVDRLRIKIRMILFDNKKCNIVETDMETFQCRIMSATSIYTVL